MSRPGPTGKSKPLGAFLDGLERAGNRLPDPVTLFLLGSLLVMGLSAVGAALSWQVDKPKATVVTEPVTDPSTGKPLRIRTTDRARRKVELRKAADGTPELSEVSQPVVRDGRLVMRKDAETVRVRSLLSSEGIRWLFDNLVHNFTGFHPLGVVLVAMLGIGVAEKSKLMSALLRSLALLTPTRLLNPAMVLLGVLSSLAADAGLVVLPPLAALLYKSVGKSPLTGIAAVFAGVSGGFSANLVITSLDPLLSGLSTEGAQLIDPTYEVLPTANWYFMVVSTVLLTLVGWAVTARLVEPRFIHKSPEEGGPSASTAEERAAGELSADDRRGLRAAGLWGALVLAGCLSLIFVPSAPLWSPAGESPRWGAAIVPMLLFVFLAMGLAFGITTGSLQREAGVSRKDTAVAKMMAETMSDMAPYIVLAFCAGQFVALFNHSQLGIMLAVVGGNALAAMALPPQLLMLVFIVVSMGGNMLVGSASAKYAFFAPVFVPMFMAAGISPEMTQAAYRVGDSCTNIVTPLNPYFVVLLVFIRKHAPRAGMGTVVSMMAPYAVAFWLAWSVLLLIWMTFGWDLGPGGPILYVDPTAALGK